MLSRERQKTPGGWIDVSVALRGGMVHWPDNPPVRIERMLDIEPGDTANVSKIAIGPHTGTHMDAPLRFIREGGEETHRALLGAGVWVIEGLDLSEVEPGEYELICLSIKVERSDGAPARAILRKI
jgi:kynurenine formamidase